MTISGQDNGNSNDLSEYDQSEGRKREDVAIIVMIATDSRSIHVGTPKSSQRIMGRPQNDIVVPAIELHLMIPLDP